MTVGLKVAIMFGTLVISLLMGHPLALSLGGVGVIFGFFWLGAGAFGIFTSRIYGLMMNYTLIAVPLFVMMACFLNKSGVARIMFDGMRHLTGSLKGGVAVAVDLVCTLMAASTGIIGASVVSMGLLATPHMLRYKYNKALTAGIICAGGTLGILIPPSIMLVSMGAQTGQSVGRLFMGGIGPGLVLSGLYTVYILILCNIKPSYGPPLPKEERIAVFERLKRAMVGVVPPIALILAVLGSILFGVATPNEAGAIGAVAALVMMFVYGNFSLKAFSEAFTETLKITCMVMLIFAGAACFTGTFMAIGGGKYVESILVSMDKWMAFAVMMLIIFFLGMFVDWLGILLLVIPVFYPIATIRFGFDPLWFCLVVAVNLQMSFLTPPFGYALFYLKGVAPPDMTMGDIYKGIIPFVLLQMVGLALVIAIPEIATYLPTIMHW